MVQQIAVPHAVKLAAKNDLLHCLDDMVVGAIADEEPMLAEAYRRLQTSLVRRWKLVKR